MLFHVLPLVKPAPVLCLVFAATVVASEKGVVVGRLTFTEDGDHIDCRRMGVGGKAIPPNISKVRSCKGVQQQAVELPSDCSVVQMGCISARHGASAGTEAQLPAVELTPTDLQRITLLKGLPWLCCCWPLAGV
jgi:hypothetical protein